MTKADGTVETTEYILHGKHIIHLRRGNHEMHFFYDAQNRPVIVDFDGIVYRYLYNLQGDILGILDSSGNLVVEYAYDAWGKCEIMHTLNIEYDMLANLNPFRYRGYIYDEETGLYYLKSRYYDAQVKRFINADIFVTRNGVIEKNSFVLF